MTRVGSTGRGLGVAGGEGTGDDVGRQQEQCFMLCCTASIERRVTPRSGVVEDERANPGQNASLVSWMFIRTHYRSMGYRPAQAVVNTNQQQSVGGGQKPSLGVPGTRRPNLVSTGSTFFWGCSSSGA